MGKMENLPDKIKKDAMKSGFPSELKAESIFRKRNWIVTGNTYFVDQDEDKGREIDLTAHFNNGNSEIDPVVFAWSFISAEIKKSEKPWVVFSSNRSWRERGFFSILSHLHNTKKLIDIKFLENIHPTLNLPRIGRTSHVAFSHDTSTIFGAIVGATKAAIDSHRASKDHGEIWSDNSIDLVFYEPIVIVDGPLFECYLDGDGEPVVEKVNFLQYGLHYASPNYKAKQYLVDIVTIDNLDKYLSVREDWVSKMYTSVYKKALEKGKNP